MKRVIALFLSAILLVSLSVPAFAAEPQQSNRIHAALDTPEFKSAYKDLQVVNEIIEEVPNSNICYIYHDLSDGNSISYMLKNNKVVYKAYVVTKEHKVTEYNYSEDGTCVASTKAIFYCNWEALKNQGFYQISYCQTYWLLSLVSHDFLHFLPHPSTAESPCNSGAFGLFLYF